MSEFRFGTKLPLLIPYKLFFDIVISSGKPTLTSTLQRDVNPSFRTLLPMYCEIRGGVG